MKSKKEHHPSATDKRQTVKVLSFDKGGYGLALLAILLISFIAYLPALSNGFAWDDNGYIENDPLIHSFNLKEIFSTFIMGNYHPITMLVFAVEYHLFGMTPTGYHVMNLLFHLVNVVLVFYTIYILSDKAEVALVVALLFGVHPMHVESVAWASELKDLLYTLFFLASFIFYLKYFKAGERKFYFLSLLLFLLSLFSKGMAVSFPFILILADYFKGRKMDAKAWIEKVPYFVLAIIFGVIAVYAQKSNNSIQDIALFTFPQRIVFACYGFINYIIKLILPLSLSSFYPYPIKSGMDLPALYYVYVLFFLALAALVYYSLRSSKKIIFGIGFFTLTIFLVLQLLPVGNTIMSDRYSYVPSIGIFYLLAEGFYYLWNKKEKGSGSRTLPYILLTVLVIFYSAKTYSRCAVWKSDLTLWGDVIKQDQTIPIAYYNHGMVMKNENRYEEGIRDFSKTIELQANFHEAYNNRGNLLTKINRPDLALEDYNRTLKMKPDYAEAYYNRGLLLMNANRDEEAIKDFNKNLELKPDNHEAHNNLAVLLAKQNKVDEALLHYDKAIKAKAGYSEAYYNRGNLLKKMQRNDEAVRDYTKAIELQPDLYDAYNNRGLIFNKEKKYEDALKDFDKAIELRPEAYTSYFNRGLVLMNEKKFEPAIAAYSKAIELRPNYVEAWYNRAMTEYYAGKKDDACRDFQTAADLGMQPAANAFSKICH